jgi:hypothetical protein
MALSSFAIDQLVNGTEALRPSKNVKIRGQDELVV